MATTSETKKKSTEAVTGKHHCGKWRIHDRDKTGLLCQQQQRRQRCKEARLQKKETLPPAPTAIVENHHGHCNDNDASR
jgi:hypothetical protein